MYSVVFHVLIPKRVVATRFWVDSSLDAGFIPTISIFTGVIAVMDSSEI